MVFLAHLQKKCKKVSTCYVWCRDGKVFLRRPGGENDMSKLNDQNYYGDVTITELLYKVVYSGTVLLLTKIPYVDTL